MLWEGRNPDEDPVWCEDEGKRLRNIEIN